MSQEEVKDFIKFQVVSVGEVASLKIANVSFSLEGEEVGTIVGGRELRERAGTYERCARVGEG